MVTVSTPVLEQDGSRRTVRGRIAWADYSGSVLYTADAPIEPHAEAFAAVGLMAAMSRGEELVVEAALSPRFVGAVVEIQRIINAWYPAYRVVPVIAPAADVPPSAPARRTAAFFSGGVDSFATALAHPGEIDALLLVWGFDIPLKADALWAETRTRLAAAAEALGIPLLTFETNVTALLDRVGRWSLLCHGAGLASIGLLLQHDVGRVLIPSSHYYTDLFPWGSHPLLDPLWSTERVDFIHDGAHLTRAVKMARVASSDVALARLRVCTRNPEGAYNCGRCEKCRRTLCGLYIAGALDRATSFVRPSNPAELGSLWIPDESVAVFVRENLVAARAAGLTSLVDALEESLWRYDLRIHLEGLKRALTARSPAAVLRSVFGRATRSRS